MAITRTWFGGNGNYRNASDWTPSGVPQPGDTAVIDTGTVNVRDQLISGTTLNLDGSSSATQPELILSNAVLDANSGIAPVTPTLDGYGKVTMRNLVINDGVIKTFAGRFASGSYNFEVAGRSAFVNAGNASLYGATVDLGPRSALVNTGDLSLTYPAFLTGVGAPGL